MTNVEETCKKFMQSSFQMNSNKELPLPEYYVNMNSFQNADSWKKSKIVNNVVHSYEVS